VPPRKKIDLPDHVRDAVLGDIRLSEEIAKRADEDFKIRVHYAVEQGVMQGEIAEKLGVSQQMVSKLVRQGREALAERERVRLEQAGSRRDREDPDRPRELAAHA
jgi:predicted XRE-type DNA-binding protein